MFGNIRIYKVKNILRMIPDHRDTFQIIQTLFPSYGHLSNHPDTFQIIRIPFRSSVHISYHLDTTHFRSPGSSRHFSYHQNTFRITQRLVRSSGYFADHSNTFRSSRHFAYHPNSLRSSWQFPYSTQRDSQQNLSGFAKTLRPAFMRCLFFWLWTPLKYMWQILLCRQVIEPTKR